MAAAVRSSIRSRRVSSKPSMFGIITSARIRSGIALLGELERAIAVARRADVVAAAAFDLQAGDERIVVHDEQRGPRRPVERYLERVGAHHSPIGTSDVRVKPADLSRRRLGENGFVGG